MKALFILLIAPVLAFAQGSIGTGNPVVTNPLGQPIPGATVAVCNSNPGSPTSGGCPGHLVTTYTDITAATSCTGTSQPLNNSGFPSVGSGCSNPGTVDGLGNVVVYAQPGQYWCEEYGAQIVGVNVTPCIFPATASGGAWSFLSIQVKNLENVLYADQFAGSDIGAQINAAYADCPAAGCVIYVPSKSDGTCYSYTTPIVLATAGKYVRLEGLGAGGDNGSGTLGACLNYTPTTGTALTLDYVPLVRSASSSNHGIRNLTLINNMCGTSGGCAANAATIGLLIGNTNQGIYEGTVDGLAVNGFGVGIATANTASVDVEWRNIQLFNNRVTALQLGSTTSQSLTGWTFHNGTWAGNQKVVQCVAGNVSSSPELYIFGTAIFNNFGLIVDCTALSTPANIQFYGGHLEAPGTASSTGSEMIAGDVDFYMSGGVLELDACSGALDWMVSTGGNFLWLDGVKLGTPCTVSEIVLANSPVRGRFTGMNNSPGHFTNFVAGTNAAKITTCILNGPSGTAATPCTFEGPVSSPTFDVGAGQALLFDASPAPNSTGTALKGQCYYDQTGNILSCAYNNGGYGTVPLINKPWTWTAAQTFPAITASSISLTALSESSTAPTISSGFGTTPSIVNPNGTAAFEINVGTGGTATNGVIGLPAAAHGWACHFADITTTSATVFVTKQIASTTSSATIGNYNTSAVQSAWVASDVLVGGCSAF